MIDKENSQKTQNIQNNERDDNFLDLNTINDYLNEALDIFVDQLNAKIKAYINITKMNVIFL